MKKNIALFAILVLLIVGTYFLQEKRVENERLESQKQGLLIQQEITHLKLPHIEAKKVNGQWWSGKELLSHNTFKQIEKKLSQIKQEKEVTAEWKSYFSKPFLFQVNGEDWAIGDMTLDKQSFYISRGNKIYMAYVEGESTQLTRNEAEIEGIKRDELLALLSKPAKDFFENQLFRYYPKLPMERVLVTTEGNLPYELDLKNNLTLPPPFKGVNVHEDLKGKFNSLLTQANIKAEVPYSPSLQYKKMGEVVFLDAHHKVKWELWLISDKKADAVIIDPDLKKAYSVVGGTLKLFFVNVQDFWDKKVIPQKDFESFDRLKASFVQGDKSAQVTIINKEPFDFEAPGFKVDKLKMEELLQYIFNLGPKVQGDRVSNLSSSERKELLSGNHLRVEVMGQELILWRKQEELIVANLTQGFKVHFGLLNENFRATFSDVLK